ncbi:hypothetical protein ACH5RR_012602 [Cinchona calisaya]|uniref:Uncharacterized protein n=1 Tax=Cinchona calisaya TaxID=153742 RepID=A0ABD3A863_9GENT
MVEDLEEIMQRFSLSADEVTSADLCSGKLHKGIELCQKSLFEKVIREKQVNLLGSVVELGPNLFQFDLGLESDLNRDVVLNQVGGKEGKNIKLLVEVDISWPLQQGSIIRVDGVGR